MFLIWAGLILGAGAYAAFILVWLGVFTLRLLFNRPVILVRTQPRRRCGGR